MDRDQQIQNKSVGASSDMLTECLDEHVSAGAHQVSNYTPSQMVLQKPQLSLMPQTQQNQSAVLSQVTNSFVEMQDEELRANDGGEQNSISIINTNKDMDHITNSGDGFSIQPKMMMLMQNGTSKLIGSKSIMKTSSMIMTDSQNTMSQSCVAATFNL